MSITIEDMKMPKSCIACPFEHNGDCYGGKPKRIMDIEDFKGSRHPDCPLIEAEPIKHGRWETGRSGHDAICTNCRKYWIPIEDKYDYWFCPRCGAKMDGGENG